MRDDRRDSPEPVGDTLDDTMRDAVAEALPIAAVMLATSGAFGYDESDEGQRFVEAGADVRQRAYALGLAVGLRMARALED